MAMDEVQTSWTARCTCASDFNIGLFKCHFVIYHAKKIGIYFNAEGMDKIFSSNWRCFSSDDVSANTSFADCFTMVRLEWL